MDAAGGHKRDSPKQSSPCIPIDGVHEYPFRNNDNVAICNLDIDGIGDTAFFIIDLRLKHFGAFD